MSETLDPKQHYFYIKAKLECGASVEIKQRQPGVPWEIVVTPKPGTTVGDFARFVDGEVRINVEQGSAIGLYQLFSLILNPPRKKQKFLGIF